ncbi:hypothetical protein EDB19DRAFT_1723168 [Suillus lakei]|nr:hypothetical protein EDB19DRAFT_1723168 [Suillus lakei]
MFSTARPPWQCQYVPPNIPTISPLALHDARYEGWPHPPVQLPHVASPSSTARHIAVANNIPSHRPQRNAAHTPPYPIHTQYGTLPRMNLGAQASANIMGAVDPQCRNIPNSWTRNGSARVPFLQGAFDTHTTTRHDTENTRFIYDHSAPRTISSNVNETQQAYPHPFLAPPSMPLLYDLRFPPTSLGFPLSSPHAGCGYELLLVPLTPERPRQIRLISPDFPWAFDIGPDPSAEEEGVTCFDVLATLHTALQHPLTDTEWGTAGDSKRASLLRARDRRLGIRPALQGSSGSAARTRPTVRFAPGADAPNHRPVQREPLLLRVDWLGSRVAFVGLIKDEAFARSRLIPGGEEPPETWVVRFQML